MGRLKASEGQWYADLATHEIFCVIRVDDADGLIDVRDGYGDIDEFDFDEWDHMDLEICAAPRDWLVDDDDEDDAFDARDPQEGGGRQLGTDEVRAAGQRRR